MVVIRNYSLSSPHNTRCWLYSNSRLTDVGSDEEESYPSGRDYQRHWTTDCNYSHHSESRWDVSRIISGSFIMKHQRWELESFIETSAGQQVDYVVYWESRIGESSHRTARVEALGQCQL